MVEVDSLKCFLTPVDFDECADATTNNCDSNANCTNTPGSFTCTCNQGYTGNGLICAGINYLTLPKVSVVWEMM